MRWILLALALPGIAQAAEWKVLTGPEITTALTARLLVYQDGARQQFNADGTTLYENPAPANGYWRVEGDLYCSQWPPSDRWTCYDVAQNGLAIRFSDQRGTITEARYADLR